MPNKTKQNERLSSCVVKSPTDDVELDEYLGWKTIFSILGRP
jgi:hypothetical protein